jgi:two-component system, cell cycle sensor histidine kinase and response regulator CckA
VTPAGDSGNSEVPAGAETSRRDLLAVLDALPAWRLTLDADDCVVDSRLPEDHPLVSRLGALRGASLCQALPAPASEVLVTAVRQCRSRGECATVRYELDEPGGTRSYEARVVPLHGGRVCVVSLDITSHATTLEALRRSEERFRLAFKTSPDSIAINRVTDGQYVAVNDGFIELLGWHEGEVIGRTSLDLGIWARAEERASLLAELGRSGRARIEGHFRRRNGEIGIGVLSAALFDIDGIPHILSVTRDVTQERAAEQERLRLEQALRQSQKLESVGVLAGGVAHEFRNLLQIIRSYLDLLAKDAEGGSSASRYLRELAQTVERGADITAQLLAFSRKAEVRMRRVDANDVAKEVTRLLEHTLPKTIRLELRLAPQAAVVNGDPSQLAQVLVNLAVNSRDAMPHGGLLEIVTESTAPKDGGPAAGTDAGSGGYVCISVRDRGHGMDEETVQRVFDPFFTTKEVGRGTGLGLSVAYGIVKAHGGHIRCASAPGQGTTFTVFLPAVEGGPVVSPAVAAPAPSPPGHETILLVDDEPAIIGALETVLSLQGYRTLSATTSEEALAIYRAQGREIDVIVMDCGLPGAGGDDCLREVRRLNAEAKVIVSSGLAWSGWEEAGAAACLTKPFPASELLTTVRRVLAQGASPERGPRP